MNEKEIAQAIHSLGEEDINKIDLVDVFSMALAEKVKKFDDSRFHANCWYGAETK